MRKPRDYDAELKALNDKARQLREQKLRQLGELVVVIGADALPIEQLAGALLSAIDTRDAAIKESWRKRGVAFFQTAPRGARGADKSDLRTAPGAGSPAPAASEDRA
ncbi:conjugal transfer protein TraD [Sphingomonas sp. KR3-1]|uniref:conjugal transfer protein TraD n=1 Tax=Sphingomonas sp. KR3-1 TaxID=3156611 RepID=UPI0032B5440D